MATKRKGGKAKGRKGRLPLDTGSPIIIDGGSLGLFFNPSEYDPPSAGIFTHKNAVAEIAKVSLRGSVNQDIQVNGKVKIIIFPK